jgi:hypothetical protein
MRSHSSIYLRHPQHRTHGEDWIDMRCLMIGTGERARLTAGEARGDLRVVVSVVSSVGSSEEQDHFELTLSK